MTGKQQLRWGVLGIYAVVAAEALMAFDQARPAAWIAWGAGLVLAGAAVHRWNRRRPG